MPSPGAAPQALGALGPQERACMFCGAPLADRGPAFVDHIHESAACNEAYQAWLERLDQDRPGG